MCGDLILSLNVHTPAVSLVVNAKTSHSQTIHAPTLSENEQSGVESRDAPTNSSTVVGDGQR